MAGTRPSPTNRLFAPNVCTLMIPRTNGRDRVKAAPRRVSSMRLACPSPMEWSPANNMSKRRHAMGNSRWVASSTAIADRRMPVMIAPQAFRKSLLALVLALLDDVDVDASLLTALFCVSMSCEVRSKYPRCLICSSWSFVVEAVAVAPGARSHRASSARQSLQVFGAPCSSWYFPAGQISCMGEKSRQDIIWSEKK